MVEKVWPKSEADFIEYVRSQLNEKHDYSTSADALSNIAIAAFNFAASQLGVTGFQAGWASLQFVREVRDIEGPFGIVNGEDFLFPQYNPIARVASWHEEWKPKLKEMAAKKLLEASGPVHPEVLKRWEEYADLKLEEN